MGHLPQGGGGVRSGGLVEERDGAPALVGSRCSACRTLYFPRTDVCAGCLSTDLHDAPLARAGHLHSVTTVAMAPPGFEVPYRLGWVDLDDGVRVFGRVLSADGADPMVGDRMALTTTVIRSNDEGGPIQGHAFTTS